MPRSDDHVCLQTLRVVPGGYAYTRTIWRPSEGGGSPNVYRGMLTCTFAYYQHVNPLIGRLLPARPQPPHDHVPQTDNVRASLDVRASNRKVPFRRY